jgi:hypothetical protein
MNEQPVSHDERTDAVVGTSCRLAYLVLSSGVLTIAAVRALAFGEACWDLLGLYIVSNAVLLVHQCVKHVRVFSWRWMLLFALAGAVFGVAFSLLRQYF